MTKFNKVPNQEMTRETEINRDSPLYELILIIAEQAVKETFEENR